MFGLLDPDDRNPGRNSALDARSIPASLRSLAESAPYFQPSRELVDAVNVALAVGTPLLLTGEPGTGKTQVAHYLAWYFDAPLFPLYVRSTATADDLFYRFDAVAYLHAGNDPAIDREDLPKVKKQLVEQGKGPLWQAYETDRTAVVLIDEIDKASRDFPNDLLNAIDQYEFAVPELGDRITCKGAPPMVLITSNSERRLPEPFLRRCIVHHIALDDELIKRAVRARQGDFPDLDQAFCDAAIDRFAELRSHELRKRPATGELLTWLAVLSARGDVTREDIEQSSLRDLPALSALIKDHEDLDMLR
ncbi:MAG: MoxR family ATPase [Proteobacteria bacterium]|nr:MoxR family ATPase [Pseudomonadota bacterium]